MSTRRSRIPREVWCVEHPDGSPCDAWDDEESARTNAEHGDRVVRYVPAEERSELSLRVRVGEHGVSHQEPAPSQEGGEVLGECNVSELRANAPDQWMYSEARRLCDSHEALRARAERAERERDELLAAAREAIPAAEHPAEKTAHNWAWQIKALGQDRRFAYEQMDRQAHFSGERVARAEGALREIAGDDDPHEAVGIARAYFAASEGGEKARSSCGHTEPERNCYECFAGTTAQPAPETAMAQVCWSCSGTECACTGTAPADGREGER